MDQTAIPFLFMRGGTSRGPYFNRADLPKDLDLLADVLIAVVGSGHVLNIDGIGGGAAVTTKVAMLSKSDDPWADVDYFFAQVSVEDQLVDFKPTCGNILSAVAHAAVEMGLVAAQDGTTEIRIRAVNTGARIRATLSIRDGLPVYHGQTAIDGVNGTHAPVTLSFDQVAASTTGQMLPTGNPIDVVDGVEVTCLDVAMPMVIGRAEDFGISGHETALELDANTALFKRIEEIRLLAAHKMGMGDASKSVTPKFGLVAPPQAGGDLAARYFMPWSTHPTLAVTGSQCMAACALLPGSVADGIVPVQSSPAKLLLEHPMGALDVITEFENGPDGFRHISGGLTRTARLLARGEVFVASAVWDGTS